MDFYLGLSLISKAREQEERVSEVPADVKMLWCLKPVPQGCWQQREHHHPHCIQMCQCWSIWSTILHSYPYKWPLSPFLPVQILSNSIIPTHGPSAAQGLLWATGLEAASFSLKPFEPHLPTSAFFLPSSRATRLRIPYVPPLEWPADVSKAGA